VDDAGVFPGVRDTILDQCGDQNHPRSRCQVSTRFLTSVVTRITPRADVEWLVAYHRWSDDHEDHIADGRGWSWWRGGPRNLPKPGLTVS
jgi:hypothetical protein